MHLPPCKCIESNRMRVSIVDAFHQNLTIMQQVCRLSMNQVPISLSLSLVGHGRTFTRAFPILSCFCRFFRSSSFLNFFILYNNKKYQILQENLNRN